MARTALLHHDDFVLHDVGPDHPERPDRIREIINKIDESTLAEELIKVEAQESPRDLLALNHTLQHLEWVEQLHKLPRATAVSADTVACAETPRIARIATGAVLGAIDAVMEGQADNAFCAVRPPGHHAENDRAMGFCFFNNVAIGARYLRTHYQLDRVAIIDWDVHHGNGTQHSFSADPSIFFFSIHQYPHYPGTGAANESGSGLGEGTTLNIPVAAGSDDQTYITHFEQSLLPHLERFQPDFVLLSAGFDAHERDPLGQVNLSTEGFATLSNIVLQAASDLCDGRFVSTLEGGYDLDATADSALAHLQALLQA